MTPALDLLPIGEATLLLARFSRMLPDSDRDKKSACEVIERLDGLYAIIGAVALDAARYRKLRTLAVESHDLEAFVALKQLDYGTTEQFDAAVESLPDWRPRYDR